MNQIDRNLRMLSQVTRKKSTAFLIKKLDKVFSEFIRLRDADENGICRCITCGTFRHWRNLDCGHFVKRQHKGTRFNEMNCSSQCKPCNGFEQGSDTKYRAALVEKYGEDKVLLLESAIGKTVKWSAFELEYLIKDYSQKVTELKKSKGCH